MAITEALNTDDSDNNQIQIAPGVTLTDVQTDGYPMEKAISDEITFDVDSADDIVETANSFIVPAVGASGNPHDVQISKESSNLPVELVGEDSQMARKDGKNVATFYTGGCSCHDNSVNIPIKPFIDRKVCKHRAAAVLEVSGKKEISGDALIAAADSAKELLYLMLK